MLQTLGIASRRAHGLFRPIIRATRAGAAPFTTTPVAQKVQYPPRPKPPPESEILESYLKGSGPGGQKIVSLSLREIALPCPEGLIYWITEQDQLGRPAKAHPLRRRRQMPRDTLARAEPQACETAPC